MMTVLRPTRDEASEQGGVGDVGEDDVRGEAADDDLVLDGDPERIHAERYRTVGLEHDAERAGPRLLGFVIGVAAGNRRELVVAVRLRAGGPVGAANRLARA